VASILIVEDSPTDALVLRRALEQHGHSVTVATDGEAGIHRAIDDQPDLILMDIVMPRLNGFEATRELRKYKHTSDIPVIMVSTKKQQTDRIWGLRQGAVDYICKPVDVALLVASVDQAIAGSSESAGTCET